MSVNSPERLWNRSFLLCTLNNLFLFTYHFAMLTMLPIYIMQDLGGTITQAGLALTLFLASAIALRPFTGMLIEKMGQRRCFRFAAVLFVLIAISYSWVDSLTSLLIVRFIHGFCFSVLTTVSVPVVNEFIPEQRKGEGMGYFIMSINLGVILGPLTALTLIQSSGFALLFIVFSAISAAGYLFCLSISIQDQERVVATKQNRHISLEDVFEAKVLSISLIALLAAFSYSSISCFITTFAESRNLLPYTSGFFIVFAVSMMVVRPWVGRYYDRKGANRVMYPSFVFFALGLCLVSFVQHQYSLWLSAVFMGIGYGSLFPCMQTIAMQSVSKMRIGHAMSTFFTGFDLGLVLGSVLLGMLIAGFGFQVAYLICSAVVILTLVLYRKWLAPQLQSKAKLNLIAPSVKE